MELKSILQTEAAMYSLAEMLSVLSVALLGGAIVYWTYGATSEGVFYYKGFHMSLVFVPLVEDRTNLAFVTAAALGCVTLALLMIVARSTTASPVPA